MVKKLILIFIILIVLFASPAFAADYYVASSATGDSSGSSTANFMSLNTFNTSASPGDTALMYDDEGNYSIPISPTNSGTLANRITYQADTGETPTIVNNRVVTLDGDDYIVIRGITGYDNDVGGSDLILITGGSNYNEFDSCTFYRVGEPNNQSGYALMMIKTIDGSSNWNTHNWIHDCTMYQGGYVEWAGYCNDASRLINLAEHYAANPDHESGHNTFENNTFYKGSHHLMQISSNYNVIRNNVWHNECWMSPPDGHTYAECVAAKHPGCVDCGAGDPRYEKYGGRCILFVGDNAGGIPYNLLEGNRFGHAGRPPDDDGANNIVTEQPYTIIRYNYSFGANSTGIYMRDGVDNNHIYNNTVYYNGRIDNAYMSGGADFAGFALVSDGATGNQVINNIVYDNYDDWKGTAARWAGTTRRGNHDTNGEAGFADSHGDPLFVNTTLSWWNDPDYTATRPDLRLQSGSPCIDNGSYLTQASGSGSNSTTLVVDDAGFFQDGTWGSSLSTIEADYIAIGTVTNTVQISSINYATNTITLAAQKSWADDANIWLAKKSDGGTVLYGSAPDQGAYESLGSVAATGTLTANITESGLVAGGATLVYTLTGTTWVATAGDNNAITQAIIDGLDSNKAEAAGWDAVVKAELTHTSVVRTSDTVLTITLPAFDGGAYSLYNITDDETITGTIPATAVESASAIVATPTITIEDEQIAAESVSASYDSNGPAADYDVNGPDWIAP